MSEYFNVDGEDEAENVEESTFEPDPSTIAFLDQESAAFAEVADEFERTYGFRHDCQCDKDYAEGRVGEVTECYAGMIVEALATCAKLKYETTQLRSMVESLIEMNNNLMDAAVGEAGEDNVIQAEIEQYADDEPDQG